jgi:hypothetical protein
MSTRRDIDTEGEQREWDAQERAVRAERLGAEAGDDATVAQYRLIARALRDPPLDPQPRDFAARTAAQIEVRSRIANERVEVWFERTLVTLLVLAGAAVVLAYNGERLRELVSAFAVSEPVAFRVQTLASWAVAIAACVGISSAFKLDRKR